MQCPIHVPPDKYLFNVFLSLKWQILQPVEGFLLSDLNLTEIYPHPYFLFILAMENKFHLSLSSLFSPYILGSWDWFMFPFRLLC